MTMLCWLMGVGSLLFLLAGPATGVPAQAAGQTNGAIAAAGARPVGGLQLDVEPRRAQVFVDGAYAGTVDDFKGYFQHLTLPAGLHRLEVLTDGYLPLLLDVTIVPHRTITVRQPLQEASDAW
jgi:hypothetical protein